MIILGILAMLPAFIMMIVGFVLKSFTAAVKGGLMVLRLGDSLVAALLICAVTTGYLKAAFRIPWAIELIWFFIVAILVAWRIAASVPGFLIVCVPAIIISCAWVQSSFQSVNATILFGVFDTVLHALCFLELAAEAGSNDAEVSEGGDTQSV